MLSNLVRSSRPLGVLRHLRDTGLATVGAWARAAGADLADQERATAEIASAEAMRALPAADGEGSIWWGREQLSSCDAAGRAETCPEVMDITGPARCLVFGPYLPLEPGLWRATAVFDLCPDAARRRLIVEFGAMPDFTTKDVPREAGRHLVEMEALVRPEALVEVRLLMTMAGFHGELRFSGVFLKRLGDAR